MKASNIIRFALVTVFVAYFSSVSAQRVVASSYIEQTQISSKLGYSVGVVFSESNIELGAFQQNNMSSMDPEVWDDNAYERSFTGVYMNYPMLEKRMLSLNFKIRTGLSNGENFVITPAVNGDYEVSKKIKVTGGVGVRAFRPTLVSGIKIVI